MDILKVSKTDTTPEVIFDADDLLLTIKGACRPEDAQKFFNPLFSWLEDFNANHPRTNTVPLSVEVHLVYFNSLSFLSIVELFKIIRKIHDGGMKIIVEWYYGEDDDVILETGHELSDICNLPFNFIAE